MSGERKDQHVDLAAEQQSAPRARNDFDDVPFPAPCAGGIDLDQVSLRTRIGEIAWDVPLAINGMTGGGERTGAINRSLAIAARETDVPIASGSMSIAMNRPRPPSASCARRTRTGL